MLKGRAPIGNDGKPINLHHIIGEEPGAMLEIQQVLASLVDELDIVGDFRGRGAMFALEFVVDSISKAPHPTAAKDIAAYCQQRGVLILTCGTYGNIIRLLPPLTISDELLKQSMNILIEGIRSVS